MKWTWLGAQRRTEIISVLAIVIAAVGAVTSVGSLRYAREQLTESNNADASRVFIGTPTQGTDGRWTFSVRNLNAAPITRVWVDSKVGSPKQVGQTVYLTIQQMVVGDIDGCDQVALFGTNNDHPIPTAVHYTDPEGRRWKRVTGQAPVKDTDTAPSFPEVAVFGSHTRAHPC